VEKSSLQSVNIIPLFHEKSVDNVPNPVVAIPILRVYVIPIVVIPVFAKFYIKTYAIFTDIFVIL